MKIKSVVFDALTLLIPGVIFIMLFFPLLPHVFLEMIFESESSNPIILIFLVLIAYLLCIVMSALSEKVEKVLVFYRLLARLSLEGQPLWLTKSALNNFKIYFEIELDQLSHVQDKDQLEQSELDNIFILMWTFVSERSQASDNRRFSMMAAMFQNLLTVFGFATLFYPLARPFALTDRINFSFHQRLLIAAICGILTLLSWYQAQFYRKTFRRDVISRFVMIAGNSDKEKNS